MASVIFKKSIYSTLFNYKTNKFNVDEHLTNFSVWPDEVVVATIEDEDDTYGFLLEKKKEYPKLKVIKTKLKRFTPTFDGELKNAALQACSGDVLLQLDFDEKMSVFNTEEWDSLAEILLLSDDFSAAMVPSLNLFGNEESFSSFTQKWYLHKRGLYRGVVNFAKNSDGTHDTNKSDSCELIDANRDLVPSMRYFDENLFKSKYEACDFIREHKLPFIFHYGWIDLDRRVELNKNFWSKQWSAEAGKEVSVVLDKNEIAFDKFLHGLTIS